MVGRLIALAVSIAVLFGLVVVIMLRILPGPHRDIDFFVIGGVATLISLLALFLVLIAGWAKAPNVFFKRRDRPGDPKG
jgi:hypothetical protein